MDNNALKQQRNRAVKIDFDLDDNDSITEMVLRVSGLFCITKKKILRLRSPDDLDPEFTHDAVPWEQSLFLPHGSSDPLIARTIIQTARLAEIFFSERF